MYYSSTIVQNKVFFHTVTRIHVGHRMNLMQSLMLDTEDSVLRNISWWLGYKGQGDFTLVNLGCKILHRAEQFGKLQTKDWSLLKCDSVIRLVVHAVLKDCGEMSGGTHTRIQHHVPDDLNLQHNCFQTLILHVETNFQSSVFGDTIQKTSV